MLMSDVVFLVLGLGSLLATAIAAVVFAAVVVAEVRRDRRRRRASRPDPESSDS